MVFHCARLTDHITGGNLYTITFFTLYYESLVNLRWWNSLHSTIIKQPLDTVKVINSKMTDYPWT